MPEVSRQIGVRPWLIAGVVLAMAVTYYLLHITYIPTNSDDAWTTSFAYNYFYRGELHDTVFGRPAGTLIAFGYSYAALQKLALDAFGWTRSNAILLSTCLFFLSLPFWWRISRSFGCSQSVSLSYVLVFPLWEPLFRIANTARPDACCLLFVSIALFLAQQRRYIWAGVASGIAFEVHQMGILAFLLVGIHALFELRSRYKEKKQIYILLSGWFTGIILGVSYYLFLHIPYLMDTLHSVSEMHSWNGNFILDYFFVTSSYRHIPIFIFICFIIVASFWLKLVTKFLELYVIIFSILLFSVLFPRPNVYYSAYFFVFITLITTIVMERYKRLNTFLLLFVIFVVLQYSYIYYKNMSFDMSTFTTSMKREVPQTCDTITGPFNAWFAFKERRFFGTLPEMRPVVQNILKSRSICYLHRLDKNDTRDIMGKYFSMGPLVKEFDAGGQRYGLYHLHGKQ